MGSSLLSTRMASVAPGNFNGQQDDPLTKELPSEESPDAENEAGEELVIPAFVKFGLTVCPIVKAQICKQKILFNPPLNEHSELIYTMDELESSRGKLKTLTIIQAILLLMGMNMALSECRKDS